MQNILSITLIENIRNLLKESRNKLQHTVNTAIVETYWNIGRLIIEEEQQGKNRAEYGKKQLEILSEKLTDEFGKGFDVRNLRYMRTFYSTYPIRNAVRSELSWTHYRRLIRIEDVNTRNWYMEECLNENWSARALDRQINSLYYERLLSSQNKASVQNEAQEKTTPLQTNPNEFLRDPYILDFLNLPHRELVESNVEQCLINNLQKFLLELGKGFAFVERQQRISTEDQDFYIDLVFYNFKLKCFLLIDLKIGKLTHQCVGQMDTYVRVYDRFKKNDDDNPTIGLILCSEKSAAVAKYSVLTDSEQLFASKYLPYLPSEAELKRELERERALM